MNEDIKRPEIPEKLKGFQTSCPFMGFDFTLYVTRDGDSWGVGLGKNLQEGFAGFGATIPNALRDLADYLDEA